jgi:hypothetical protein
MRRSLLVLLLALTACAPEGPARYGSPQEAALAAGIDPATVVRANEDFALAMVARGSDLELHRFVRDAGGGWSGSGVGGWSSSRGQTWEGNTVVISGLPAVGSPEAGTYVFGTAEPGVAAVSVPLPGAVGGQVHDGAWLVYVPDPAMDSSGVPWRFVDADGEVLLEGTGPLDPP